MLAGWKCSLAGYTGSCLLDMLAGWICYERTPDAGSAGCAGCARGRNIKFSKASKNAFQNSRFKPVLSTFLSFWLRIPTGEQMSHFFCLFGMFGPWPIFSAFLAQGPFFLYFWSMAHFFCTFGRCQYKLKMAKLYNKKAIFSEQAKVDNPFFLEKNLAYPMRQNYRKNRRDFCAHDVLWWPMRQKHRKN